MTKKKPATTIAKRATRKRKEKEILYGNSNERNI
jgi:hypothetical protein